MQKLETSGRLLKWAVELSEFDISFKPRTAIKAHALTDFIVEAEHSKVDGMNEEWTVWVDGSSAQTGSGAGIILIFPEGQRFQHALRFNFPATNNESEYEATLAGIQMCLHVGGRRVLQDN